MDTILDSAPTTTLRTDNSGRVGLDFDQTLAATLQKTIDIHNEDKHDTVTFEDFDVYGVTGSTLEKKTGLGFFDFMKYWEIAMHERWIEIRPLAENSLLLEATRMVPIDIVTNMAEEMNVAAQRWLREFHPEFRPLFVHIDPHETKVNSGHRKYIEDNPKVANDAMHPDVSKGAHPEPFVDIVETPYTRKVVKDVGDRIKLVKDVNHSLKRTMDQIEILKAPQVPIKEPLRQPPLKSF
jgi:hypothetical protein